MKLQGSGSVHIEGRVPGRRLNTGLHKCNLQQLNGTGGRRVRVSSMKTECNQGLAKGQVWRTPVAEFEIVALGKKRIHYRVIKQAGLKWISTQISKVDALTSYLENNSAKLVRETDFRSLAE
jgi:hypothetical protein